MSTTIRETTHAEYIQFLCTMRWTFRLDYNGSGFSLTVARNGRKYQFGGTSLIDTLREAALFVESMETK